MNSIKVKSSKDGFEVEIQTDEPQTPQQMADALIDVFKAAPPPRITRVVAPNGQAALPSVDGPIDEQASEAGPHARPHKRKSSAKNIGDPVAKEPTAENRIEELIGGGKLETPLELNQVQLELERKALHYSLAHIANALATLVRKGRLDRTGAKGEYKYVRAGIHCEQEADPSLPIANAAELVAAGEQDKVATDLPLDVALAQAQQPR